MGPLAYAEAAADHFVWAHYFSFGALLMPPDGPIICSLICHRCAGVGLLEYAPAAANGFVWAK